MLDAALERKKKKKPLYKKIFMHCTYIAQYAWACMNVNDTDGTLEKSDVQTFKSLNVEKLDCSTWIHSWTFIYGLHGLRIIAMF